MNGFKDHGLDEDNFGAKGGIVSAFDAFRTWSKHDMMTLILQFLLSTLYLIMTGPVSMRKSPC